MRVLCVQVALRIRPINEAEVEEGAALVARREGKQVSWGVVHGLQESPRDGDRGHCRVARGPPVWLFWFTCKHLLPNPAKLLALL